MLRHFHQGLLLCLPPLLSGCLGGSVAQQIATSIATTVADKVVGESIAAQEKQAQNNALSMRGVLHNPSHDPYKSAMLNNFEFNRIVPIEEPLPSHDAQEEEIPLVILKTNPLVSVELYNLLIGEEKTAVLEKARLRGALNLPDMREWADWKVATGVIKSPTQSSDEMITFLIPPEMGKRPSGSLTTVELSSAGDLHIARY